MDGSGRGGRAGVSGTGVGFDGSCFRRLGSSLGIRSRRFGMAWPALEMGCPGAAGDPWPVPMPDLPVVADDSMMDESWTY